MIMTVDITQNKSPLLCIAAAVSSGFELLSLEIAVFYSFNTDFQLYKHKMQNLERSSCSLIHNY